MDMTENTDCKPEYDYDTREVKISKDKKKYIRVKPFW